MLVDSLGKLIRVLEGLNKIPCGSYFHRKEPCGILLPCVVVNDGIYQFLFSLSYYLFSLDMSLASFSFSPKSCKAGEFEKCNQGAREVSYAKSLCDSFFLKL